MERFHVRRPAFGRLGRALALPSLSGRGLPSAGTSALPRRGEGGLRWRPGTLPRALSFAPAAARACARALRRRPRLRLALLVALLSTVLLTLGWLWLRHSSLVAVRQVRVTGLQGPGARAVEAALVGAARRMSTLDVHPGALRAAVAPFPIVRDLHVSAAFPHTLRIRVIEQPPVAALVAAGGRTAVAADGVVLGAMLLSASLPTIRGAAMPPAGQRVRSSSLLVALTVIGAAPAALANDLVRAFNGPLGLTLVLRPNLLAYFGDESRPHAKWLSLARVLADPSSAGASYIDVRLPERPAAGFTPGAMPPLSTGTSANASPGEEAGSSEQAASGGAPALAGQQGSAGERPPAREGPSSGEPTSSGERTSPGERTSQGEPSSSGEAPSLGPERSSAPAGEAAGPHG
jgi:cell division protein FtsQ